MSFYVERKKVGFSINPESPVNDIKIQTLQGNNTHVNIALGCTSGPVVAGGRGD